MPERRLRTNNIAQYFQTTMAATVAIVWKKNNLLPNRKKHDYQPKQNHHHWQHGRLLLQARHCEKACLAKHGEVLTDIVADMLADNGIVISTEHFQFIREMAFRANLNETLSKPPSLTNAILAHSAVEKFCLQMKQEWAKFQDFDVDNKDMGFADSVHTYFLVNNL